MVTVKMTGDSVIKLVLTDMDDTLIPAGHDGASDYAIEGIHAMQAAGLHFGPVSGRQPSAMGWMFKKSFRVLFDRCVLQRPGYVLSTVRRSLRARL